jgi:hypothetical protein
MKLEERQPRSFGRRKWGMVIAVATALLVTAAPNTYASMIAGWDFAGVSGGAGNYGPSPMAATTSDSHVTIGGLTRGSGVATAGTAASNAWGGSGWDGTTDAAGAIAAAKVATFSAKANAGFTLSLGSIDAYNVRHSGTGPATGQWQYSLDGSLFTNLGAPITWGSNTTAAGNPQTAINLSAIPALQLLPATTTVTFRLANYNASGSGGTWYFNDPAGSAGTDFSISGSTATANVPEPASLALASIGGIALVLFRRRQT